MEQSSHNENRVHNVEGCEIIMDVLMEEEKTTDPCKNRYNLQIEASINSKRKNEQMKEIFKKMHV
jgi:hypothetical protein